MENRSNYHVQPEGVWIFNEEKGTMYRTKNGIKIEIPYDIQMENIGEKQFDRIMKQQEEAEKYFYLFQKSDVQDSRMLDTLYFMLDDYYNFLNTDNQKSFIEKMSLISKSGFVDEQNSSYLQNFCTTLSQDSYDDFYHIFDEFKNYNHYGLSNALENGIEEHHYRS